MIQKANEGLSLLSAYTPVEARVEGMLRLSESIDRVWARVGRLATKADRAWLRCIRSSDRADTTQVRLTSDWLCGD